MRTPGLCLVVAALWGACAPTSDHSSLASQAQHVDSLPAATSCKTEPPIAVSLTSRALPANRYELTVTATPTTAVDSLDVAFVLPKGARIDRADRAAFGATPKGTQRTLVAIVETTARTSEISAIARIPVEGVTMSRAATVTLGEPRPQPRTTQYALPDGELAREVRP